MDVRKCRPGIEAKAWSDKNLTKRTADVRGDEAYS